MSVPPISVSPRGAWTSDVQVVESTNPPRGLPLGEDAINAIEGQLANVREEIALRREVGAAVAYEGATYGATGGKRGWPAVARGRAWRARRSAREGLLMNSLRVRVIASQVAPPTVLFGGYPLLRLISRGAAPFREVRANE